MACLVVGLWCGGTPMTAQSSPAQFAKQADRYFATGDFRSALKLYRQGGLENSKNKEVRFRIGRCLYEINDVEGALRMYQTVIQEGKTEAEVLLHTAIAYHARLSFTEAIAYYKRFLQKSKPDDPDRARVKDDIVRCANGLRLRFGEEQAYVENAGTVINTQYTEFGVRTSPTTIDKIYFNSDRDESGAGMALRKDINIYSAGLVNGRWSAPEKLPSHINSGGYDEVCGFSSDGQILYYLTSHARSFEIRTDTFSADANGSAKGVFTGPFSPGGYGADLMFFNDTICLFASEQAGGYGGYDLYMSVWRNHGWTAPANLGPVINSRYDERSPFLTRDGLTLFYSSNNLESMGGFDVFSTSFDPSTGRWSAPDNMGMPVNSPLDEIHLVLSPDGMSAYLTSNRKDGYGMEDIYRVFFKKPLLAHQVISPVPTFYHHTLENGSTETMGMVSATKPVDAKEYFISHLFFETNADILTPQNIKKLDLMVNLMMIYPKVIVELSCFELPAGQRTFNLYFSIKKAEKAADYLVRKGIARQRIMLKGFGASFPLVAAASGTSVNPLYQKMNQRVEFTLHQTEKEPLIIHMEHTPVPENLKDPSGIRFQSLRHGLYYSVQIAAISQILQNPELESYDEMFIDVDNAQGFYRYMAGMTATYQDAEDIRAKMMALGFPDAFVVPYINGVRIARTSVPDLTETYPDLLQYLNGTRK